MEIRTDEIIINKDKIAFGFHTRLETSYSTVNQNSTYTFFSLPGLVEHFPLRQLPRSEAGCNKEDEHAGDHEVLEVVLDQVEALAGRDPGAVEVEPVSENQDSRLQSGGRRCHSPHSHHRLEMGGYQSCSR